MGGMEANGSTAGFSPIRCGGRSMRAGQMASARSSVDPVSSWFTISSRRVSSCSQSLQNPNDTVSVIATESSGVHGCGT